VVSHPGAVADQSGLISFHRSFLKIRFVHPASPHFFATHKAFIKILLLGIGVLTLIEDVAFAEHSGVALRAEFAPHLLFQLSLHGPALRVSGTGIGR
jgi:hypothetical protein